MPRLVIQWFRRDLRLHDHPSLLAASADAAVVPVVVLDPRLLARDTPRTRRYLASVAQLNHCLGGKLHVVTGDPVVVVPQLVRAWGARAVHVSAETTPYGRRRDRAVQSALPTATRWVATGSPYAIGPGVIRNGSGGPYQVFTPFLKAWRDHGWSAPAPAVEVDWAAPGLPAGVSAAALPEAEESEPVGERAAQHRWKSFLDNDLAGYALRRDLPADDATSRMSVPLKYGEIHPRTLLADLAAISASDRSIAEDVAKFQAELAWREFYADVLWHAPESAWQDLRPGLSHMPYDTGVAADQLAEAWRQGKTGYPLVDAGMRQLLAEGWMHNRVRMITASFLVKDLHRWWPIGARHFLDQLTDGDIASNNHGWQWVAGTGTDAAPYFRIFNPVTQGKRFDPTGDYVRRWVPELRHLAGVAVHEPWRATDGYRQGYPQRIVDHDAERKVALARLAEAKAGTAAR